MNPSGPEPSKQPLHSPKLNPPVTIAQAGGVAGEGVDPIRIVIGAFTFAVTAGQWTFQKTGEGIIWSGERLEDFLREHPIPGLGELIQHVFEAKELTPDERRQVEWVDETGEWVEDHPDLPEEPERVRQGEQLEKGRDHIGEANDQLRKLDKAIRHLSRIRPFRTLEAQAEIDRAIEKAEGYKEYLQNVLSGKQSSLSSPQPVATASAAHYADIYQKGAEYVCQSCNSRRLDPQQIDTLLAISLLNGTRMNYQETANILSQSPIAQHLMHRDSYQTYAYIESRLQQAEGFMERGQPITLGNLAHAAPQTSAAVDQMVLE
jgi:hypothetical protein